jgi:protein NEDD1
MLKEFAIPVASIFSTRTNGASDTSNPTAAINSDSPGAHSTINDHLPSHTRTVSGASRDTPDRVGSALSTRSHEENAFARLGLRTESASSGRVKLRSGAGATVSDSVSMSGRTRASVLGEGTGVLGQEGESSASGRLRRRAADKLAPSSSASDRASSSARSSSKLRDGTSTLSAFPSREALSHGPRASVGEMPSPSVLEDQMAVPDSTRAEEDVGSRMPNAETMPERASKEKGNSKKVGFAQRGEDSDGDGEGDLSVVLSAQRHPPAAQPNVWTTVPSPHFQPPEKGYNASASNSSHAPQDLLRSLISDVLCDFQRNQQADMVGLHVDLVRMGRGWTRELEGVRRELAELREENKVLREENARWRRGY